MENEMQLEAYTVEEYDRVIGQWTEYLERLDKADPDYEQTSLNLARLCREREDLFGVSKLSD
jgi:hypothetical protein